MNYALPLVLLAGPALALSGDGPLLHPHVGAFCLVAMALLGVAAMRAAPAPARLRSRT
jgi:NAD kinase